MGAYHTRWEILLVCLTYRGPLHWKVKPAGQLSSMYTLHYPPRPPTSRIHMVKYNHLFNWYCAIGMLVCQKEYVRRHPLTKDDWKKHIWSTASFKCINGTKSTFQNAWFIASTLKQTFKSVTPNFLPSFLSRLCRYIHVWFDTKYVV